MKKGLAEPCTDRLYATNHLNQRKKIKPEKRSFRVYPSDKKIVKTGTYYWGKGYEIRNKSIHFEEEYELVQTR